MGSQARRTSLLTRTCGAPQFTFTNNKITNLGFQYDAAGNLTNDGSHSYTYDPENQVTAVDGGSTASYVYDAAGQRLLKTMGSATTTYVRGSDGDVVAEVNGSGAWTNAYMYLGGQMLAQYSGGSGGTTYFALPDSLNSSRLLTAMDQSVYDSLDFLPFGEQIGGSSGTTHKFTGYERDGESGKDYAFARYFGSNMGRFMSPDPLAGNASDPQSLNLYTYVRNNPANLIDPSGLCSESFWGGSCNDFGISITWGWGSGRDDAPTPLHPHPTRPPNRTGPAPHVAYGILPGETAGVPNWLNRSSNLSRFIIVNYHKQGGYIVGDFANEMACFTSAVGGPCNYLFWNAMKETWDSQKSDVPISPQASQTLAQAGNRSAAVSSPCGIGGFYIASAIAGVAGGWLAGGEAAAAGTAVYEASAPYWPSMLRFLLMQQSRGFIGIIRGVNRGVNAVGKGCASLE